MIKLEIAQERIEPLIIELWKAVTAQQWKKACDFLIALMKIAKGDSFDELFFLYDIADIRGDMAFREELNNA